MVSTRVHDREVVHFRLEVTDNGCMGTEGRPKGQVEPFVTSGEWESEVRLFYIGEGSRWLFGETLRSLCDVFLVSLALSCLKLPYIANTRRKGSLFRTRSREGLAVYFASRKIGGTMGGTESGGWTWWLVGRSITRCEVERGLGRPLVKHGGQSVSLRGEVRSRCLAARLNMS